MQRTPSYTQSYTGELCCYLRPGTPHCGATSGNATFPVSVTIHWGYTPLDANGFLLDNTWFREYFEAFRGVQLGVSCERLLALVVSQVIDAIEDRNRTVAGLGVSPASGYSGTWRKVEASLRGIPAVTLHAEVVNGGIGGSDPLPLPVSAEAGRVAGWWQDRLAGIPAPDAKPEPAWTDAGKRIERPKPIIPVYLAKPSADHLHASGFSSALDRLREDYGVTEVCTHEDTFEVAGVLHRLNPAVDEGIPAQDSDAVLAGAR